MRGKKQHYSCYVFTTLRFLLDIWKLILYLKHLSAKIELGTIVSLFIDNLLEYLYHRRTVYC